MTIPAKPPIAQGDLVVSILVMVLIPVVGAGAAMMGIFMLAFLDHCPPETCSADGAVLSVLTAIGIALVVGVAGIVVTIVRLARRKIAWPFALGTLMLCGAVGAVGLVGYFIAVGAGASG